MRLKERFPGIYGQQRTTLVAKTSYLETTTKKQNSDEKEGRMGVKNKSRGSIHHVQQRESQSNLRQLDGSSSADKFSDSTSGLPFIDLNKVLQESEDNSRFSFRDLAFCISGVLALAMFSILVGFAAGMTISIHYYDDQGPIDVRHMGERETSTMYSGSAAYRKVTTLDPTIASSNVLESRHRDGLDLGKVITTSASGQLNVLMVVEEAIPLHAGAGSKASSTSSHSDNPYGTKGGKDEISAMIPLTMEQANLLSPGYSKWKENQPDIVIRQPKMLPRPCPDGYTEGFDDWFTFKAAVEEANSLSAEKFMKWSAYFATVGKSTAVFEDDRLYYEHDVVFTICPGLTLRARKGPVYINAENVVIQCHKCTIHVGGTHLDFGPHAKNVLIRGVTFKGAHSSSVTLFQDGAEASFEDCVWESNSGVNASFGGVADVNSTSTVSFYRCEISHGSTVSALGKAQTDTTSSFSIRTKH